MKNTLYIVIPCYNEEAVLEETSKRLSEKMNHLISSGYISDKSKVLFVDNGSEDSTWEKIKQLHEKNDLFSGISLSRNKGYQNGIMAGLMAAKKYCDFAITMDADLQDDINATDEMVKKYLEGSEVVYGVRSSRRTDTFLKRFTAESFYKFMKILGDEIVFNHGDFRLMSVRVLDALQEYKEVNLFLRGIVPQIGFKSDCVYYERHKRFAGKSKYHIRALLSFALDGLTSFSAKPLKLIAITGILISFVSFIAFIWAFAGYFFGNTGVVGWTSLICSLWFLGGLQIFFLGVIGEYIGRIYSEAKRRPRYIISDTLLDEERFAQVENSAQNI